MLSEKEFYLYVEKNILKYLPEMEDQKVMVQRVKKNNQVSMMGLSIGEQKNYLLPVLYLEPFYRNHLRGQTIEETMREIASVYQGHQVGFYLDEDKVSDYELDLGVTYRWAAYRNHDGMASALVRNKELLMWGISKDQMMKDARENTEKIFPPVMRKIQSVLPIHIIEEEIPLFVMSNGDYMNGASVILYKDVLRDFAKYMEYDLYILPSSIHEVIILLDNEYAKAPEELARMVRETNRIVVDREEILSDHVYYYDREKDEIRIAK